MQDYLADLHIHSRFSRATSKRLNIPLLAAWARLKGLAVVGTGDFTHPKWRDELREHLRFDEKSGLYVLKRADALAAALPELPVEAMGARGVLGPDGEKRSEDSTGSGVPQAHFMLQGEISSIYKRGGKVRKVHNLVFMPDLETAERFSLRLAEVGNLNADGRPILGLDSRDLLELVLESHPQAFLVPAHIWTPWFSIFGSKSGFDSMEECFGDLASEIFALETGLSSDPAMNRMWSALDGYRLISNSDAHSGENLGREANVFSGDISYAGMLEALKRPERENGTAFLGTLEFFPEEGKYHMDGHRKCEVLLSPAETKKLGGICPVCGGPLTVGVLNRVMELADREEPLYQDGPQKDDGAYGLGEGAFASLVPLPEVLGEILGVGAKSRKVGDMYAKVLERFGPELAVLRTVPEAELARFFPPLGEAVGRMRRGEVQLRGGFDGEYGIVRMFTEEEQREIARGAGISGVKKGRRADIQGLALPGTALKEHMGVKKAQEAASGKAHTGRQASHTSPVRPSGDDSVSDQDGEEEDFLFSELDDSFQAEETSPPVPASLEGLNAEQERAVRSGPGPVLVLAGPGTGKTRTLIARVMYLLEAGVSPRRILAVTFTRRAASEMDKRLRESLGQDAVLPGTDTLHALALEVWHKTHTDVPLLLSEESARRVFDEANADESAQARREAWQAVNLARETLNAPSPEFSVFGQRYSAQKSAWNLADYADLLEFWLERIRNGVYHPSWEHVLVDEVQDLSPLQLQLVRALLPPSGNGFFGIGDPDQSIYSFRGAHGQCRDFFALSWPDIDVVHLEHNYRSLGEILAASHAALGEQAINPALLPVRSGKAEISLFSAPSVESEAAWVAERVAALIGLGSHTLADATPARNKRGKKAPEPDHSPGDIAVLVRTHSLAVPYRKALSRQGVPVTAPATDVFWADERVGLILHEAGRMLGIAVSDTLAESDGKMPACPDKILSKGPLGVAAYLSEVPPFDVLFWRSSPFRSLVKAYDEHKNWGALISWINLRSELELVRAKGEQVQIMSMHAAKGLEFRSVFLPALEDGLIPFFGAGMLTGKLEQRPSLEQMQEEQRLFYVALSRAKDNLFLSYAKKRMLYGHELRLKPSRFLNLLPKELMASSTLVAKQTRKETQLRLF